VSARPPIVDAELHVYATSRDDVLAHFEPSLAARIEQTAFSPPKPSLHAGAEVLPSDVAAPSDPRAVAAGLPAGLARAVLLPAQIFPAAGWLDHGLAAAFASALNDHVAATWLPADERFRLAAALSAHDPETAAAELRRWRDDERVVAGCLSPIATNMGHKHYHPIYEAAQELGLPLLVHPSGAEGLALGAPALGGNEPRTAEEAFALLPQVAAANLASLLYDGVFVRYPELRIVFAGYGFAWAVPVLWRIDQEWRHLRADVPWLTKPPSEYAQEHVRFVVDSACEQLDDGAWTLIDLLPDGMLMYGSDTPFSRSGELTIGACAEHDEAILAANAAATFRLGLPLGAGR
jgi:predicted TIM-barrel fold metal-dependent hydrolase